MNGLGTTRKPKSANHTTKELAQLKKKTTPKSVSQQTQNTSERIEDRD